MKNKKVTVTIAQLNSGNVIEIDPKMVWVPLSADGTELDPVTLYPIDIQIINDTGAILLTNFILNEDDYADYQRVVDDGALALDDYYAFKRTPNNTVLQSDHTNFPRCYRFLIKGSGTATKDATIEFINYR